MAAEKQLTEQESLALITEMLQTAKGHFHTDGTSAILWGGVVALAGVVSFLEKLLKFDIGFDIWLIVLAAIIPQIFIYIREARTRKAVTHQETFLNVIWMVYAFSMFALIFYINVVPATTMKILKAEGLELFSRQQGASTYEPFQLFVFSQSSLFLILYAIPTLAMGFALKFKPMMIGGSLCYLFFIVSCFTSSTYDFLLNGLAGIFCWLIPGIILRKRRLKVREANV